MSYPLPQTGPTYPPVGGFNPNQVGGYPPNQAGGYPPNQAVGFPPKQAGGYPPNQAGGYPPNQGEGYPPNQGEGYPLNQADGYPNSSAGYPPNASGAYPPYSAGGYAAPIPSFSPYPQPGSGQYPPPGGYNSLPIQGNYPPPNDSALQFNQGTYPPPGGGQSQTENWMPMPQVSNCPPGLEYLTQVDQLIVKQKVELLEAITSFETNNKYEIKNSMGQQAYYAKEDTDCCTRMCCGPYRPFDMKILDNMKNEVMHLNRPLACDSCLFPCCLQSIEVTSPPGTVIGSVQQEWSIFTPKFSVKNANGDTVLKIDGPFCTFSFCGDVEFKVMSADGSSQVGKISKQWSGILREAFTDADHFGISFPMDLDVKMKATLLGALFLIDFMFFEKKGNQESDGLGMLT